MVSVAVIRLALAKSDQRHRNASQTKYKTNQDAPIEKG